MKKLQLFNVNDNYIDFLKQTDKTVCNNKGELRPYVGPLFSYNGLQFYAPLSTTGSTCIQHEGHANSDNYLHYKIIGHSKETIGIIRFNNMIPVPDSELKKINISVLPQIKKDLLNDDADFIRKHVNSIEAKALSLFKMKTSKVRNNQGTKKYTKMCCAFKQLTAQAKYFVQDKQHFVANIDVSKEELNGSNLLVPVKPVQKVHMNPNSVNSNTEDRFLNIGDYAINHKLESQQQKKAEVQHTKLNIKSSSFKGHHM